MFNEYGMKREPSKHLTGKAYGFIIPPEGYMANPVDLT